MFEDIGIRRYLSDAEHDRRLKGASVEMLRFDFFTRCARCDEDIKIELTGENSTLKAEPCRKCLAWAYEEGHTVGFGEGQLDCIRKENEDERRIDGLFLFTLNRCSRQV